MSSGKVDEHIPMFRGGGVSKVAVFAFRGPRCLHRQHFFLPVFFFEMGRLGAFKRSNKTAVLVGCRSAPRIQHPVEARLRSLAVLAYRWHIVGEWCEWSAHGT